MNPSGKLPVTFPKALADTPAAQGGARAYPGVEGVVHYDEGLLVGYRWYDTKNIEPLFPFGFGLSYTSFAYSKARLVEGKANLLECDVTNTGTVAGAEVVQAYSQAVDSPIVRPQKELRGFAKVSLAPGETKTVQIALSDRWNSYYSVEKHAWTAESGKFRMLVGSSSRDIRLRLETQAKSD